MSPKAQFLAAKQAAEVANREEGFARVEKPVAVSVERTVQNRRISLEREIAQFFREEQRRWAGCGKRRR